MKKEVFRRTEPLSQRAAPLPSDSELAVRSGRAQMGFTDDVMITHSLQTLGNPQHPTKDKGGGFWQKFCYKTFAKTRVPQGR